MEIRLSEFVDHRASMILDVPQIFNDSLYLLVFFAVLTLDFSYLRTKTRLQLIFLSNGHVLKVFVALNVRGYNTVLLLDCVNLIVQHVHVVVERVVLFLCLDKCGHNLLNVFDPSGLGDLVERVLNHAHVPHVHVA